MDTKRTMTYERDTFEFLSAPLDHRIDTRSGEVLRFDDGLKAALRAVTGGVFFDNLAYSGMKDEGGKIEEFISPVSGQPDADRPFCGFPFITVPEAARPLIDYSLSEVVRRSTVKVSPGISVREGGSRDWQLEVKKLMLGIFRPCMSADEPRIGKITLYTKAIAEFCASNGLDYETVFWAVLAHESFHAFHFSCFKALGKQDRWNGAFGKKSRDIVKESLASHYEYAFLINNEGSAFDSGDAKKYMDHIERSWRKYDVGSWPASGALGIGGLGISPAHDPHIAGRLIDKSLNDWKTASDIIQTGYYLADPEISGMLRP